LVADGELPAAEEHYRAAAESGEIPFAAPAQLGLAVLLEQRGDDESSDAWLNACMDTDDREAAPLAALALGRRAEAAGNHDTAAAFYRHARERGDGDAQAVAGFRLGRLLDADRQRELRLEPDLTTTTVVTYQPYWDGRGTADSGAADEAADSTEATESRTGSGPLSAQPGRRG
jgi:tetratricopeptide (TPR) repeat protein